MTIDEVIYKFKLKYDKLDTKKRFNLSIPQIILFLNEAQRRVINRKYNRDNLLKVGFEEKQKRIRELQKLLQPTVTLTASIVEENVYSVDLNTLPHTLLYIDRSQTVAKRDTCTAILDNREAAGGELNNLLRDPHYKPNFNFRETLIGYRDDKIYIYTDGTFTVDSVKLDYTKEPRDMDKEGYTTFSGVASTNVDPEFPDYVVDEIIDETVVLLSSPIEADKLFQTTKIIQSNSE